LATPYLDFVLSGEDGTPANVGDWPEFHPHLLRRERELLQSVGEVSAIWSSIEHQLNVVVAENLLHSDLAIACEVLQQLSWGRRRKLVLRLSREFLSREDAGLVARSLHALNDTQKTRHEFVHGLWGALLHRPGYLVWSPKATMMRDAAAESLAHRSANDAHWNEWLAATHRMLGALRIYGPQDLEEEVVASQTSYSYLALLTHSIGARGDPRSRSMLEEILPSRRSRERRGRRNLTRPAAGPEISDSHEH
jgi:hypothetical protein